MKKQFLFLLVVSLFSCSKQPEKLTSQVNIFVGTCGHGHTFPGATLPFGMVQLSPDNEMKGWDWCSGYNVADSIIVGFSHTHLSGTGIGDLQDVLFMPTTQAAVADTTGKGCNFISHYKSVFSHQNETGELGYYSVLLDDSKIKAELTATLHAGFHRYTFPESGESKIVIDLHNRAGENKMLESGIRVVDSVSVEGYAVIEGWAKHRKVFFSARFSKPFSKFYTSSSGELNEGNRVGAGKSSKAILQFGTKENEVILAKVGISPTSIENAKANLLSEIADWDFDGIKAAASGEWEKRLSSYQVETPDASKKKVFYTALYHSFIHPTLYSDADGSYPGMDGQIHQAKGQKNYTIFSLWDTYRALHPLLTLTDGEKVNEFIQSFLAQYREYGLLPVWPLWGNETYCMIGYHSIPVIVDAYFKGIRGFDVNEAYEAIRNTAMGHGLYDRDYQYKGLDWYIQYGYLPMDLSIAYNKEHQIRSYYEAASRTMEWAYDDWCVAQLAKALGKIEDYDLFMKRSQNYWNLVDPATGFIRPRNSDGKWVEPFDPAFAHSDNGFTEGNSWQYSWSVQHDIPGLVKMMGGKDRFIQRLDSLFQTSPDSSKIHFVDVSGLIGQYAHGNEPCHHVAYLYDYVGEPWKTQKMVAQIRDSLYTANRDGLCGNDDCGQMSAWYVFSAMGFYPVNPANGVYAIGTPAFDQLSIKTASGKVFTVVAKNLSAENVYIQSARLNGQKIEKAFIDHQTIQDGGVIEFEMGKTPNTQWGRE